MSEPLAVVLSGKAADVVRELAGSDQPTFTDAAANTLVLVGAAARLQHQQRQDMTP